jgi:hypothetical protein
MVYATKTENSLGGKSLPPSIFRQKNWTEILRISKERKSFIYETKCA